MFSVDKEKCIACEQCIKDCPTHIISLKEGRAEIYGDNCLKCGHCVAVCPVEAVSTDEYNMNEVKPYNKDTFSIDSDTLLNFIKFRRSIRRFKDKDIEQENIQKIIEAGRYTQTGTNSQDVSYVVVREKLNELKNLTYKSLKQKGEYILANLTPETEYLKGYASMWVNMYNKYQEDPAKNDNLFFNAPLAIFVTSPSPLNGGLSSSNMELMTDALGLGTFFSGFTIAAAKDNKEILDLLGVKDGNQLISCLVIGYPDVRYQRTVPRKEANINWI